MSLCFECEDCVGVNREKFIFRRKMDYKMPKVVKFALYSFQILPHVKESNLLNAVSLFQLGNLLESILSSSLALHGYP